MVRHTFKILQQMVQGFQSVSDHFGTLCIKGLKILTDIFRYLEMSSTTAKVNSLLLKFF